MLPENLQQAITDDSAREYDNIRNILQENKERYHVIYSSWHFVKAMTNKQINNGYYKACKPKSINSFTKALSWFKFNNKDIKFEESCYYTVFLDNNAVRCQKHMIKAKTIDVELNVESANKSQFYELLKKEPSKLSQASKSKLEDLTSLRYFELYEKKFGVIPSALIANQTICKKNYKISFDQALNLSDIQFTNVRPEIKNTFISEWQERCHIKSYLTLKQEFINKIKQQKLRWQPDQMTLTKFLDNISEQRDALFKNENNFFSGSKVLNALFGQFANWSTGKMGAPQILQESKLRIIQLISQILLRKQLKIEGKKIPLSTENLSLLTRLRDMHKEFEDFLKLLQEFCKEKPFSEKLRNYVMQVFSNYPKNHSPKAKCQQLLSQIQEYIRPVSSLQLKNPLANITNTGLSSDHQVIKRRKLSR